MLAVLFLFYGCATHYRETLIQASTNAKPDWINTLPQSKGIKFFRGEGEGNEPKSARNEALTDMLKRYAEYIGVDYSILVQVHQEEVKQRKDEIHRTERRVITDAEATSCIVTRGSELQEEYWEKWRRGKAYYYRYWVLGKVAEEFIKEEQKRIDSIRNAGLPLNDVVYRGGDLKVELVGGKVYKDGEPIVFRIRTDFDCFLYMLNSYDGKIRCECLGQWSKDKMKRIEALAHFGGKNQEDIKFIASERPLDLNKALRRNWPTLIVETLREEAREKEIRYAEKLITIYIEPK